LFVANTFSAKYKRKFQAQERQKIEDKLSEINQYDFWKSIGKIGIANERKNCIPLAVVDNDLPLE
jgi:hypothetical protein